MRWFRGRDLAELEDWTWATTAPEAIAILETRAVDEVSLDHDLGDEAVVGTGYDVLLWIEERVATDPGYEPPMIHIHTSNIGSRGRMESAVQGIQRLVRWRSGPGHGAR